VKRRFPKLVLPANLRLDEILFAPDAEERQYTHLEKQRQQRLARMERLAKRWEREDQARLEKRVRDLEAIVGADREFVEACNAREAEIQRVRAYYETEQRKELLARLARATKDISKDVCRAEREKLMRRGIVRGRR
jgi:hypothetical protein